MTGNTDTDTNDTSSGTEDLAELRRQLAEERASKAVLTAELTTTRKTARDATFQNMSAQERAIASDQEACEARLESLEGELGDIESQIATLTDEGGRGKEVAALTRKMSTISAEHIKEAGRKDYLTQQREKMAGQHKQVREAAPTDGAKMVADGQSITAFKPKTQAWLEKHPQSFTDVRFMKLARLAASKAIDVEGLSDDSPEFFEFVEQELGLKAAPTADDGEGEELVPDNTERYAPAKPQADAAGPGKLAAIVARPTRQTNTGTSGNGGRKPTLSNEERETALSLYSHLNISDADKLARYASGKKFMAERNNQHFRSN